MYWKHVIEILKVVVVPSFVAYPYLDDPFDDIDNQDKYLLHNYNNSPDDEFSFIFNGVNNYYSQFCKYIPFIHGSIDMDVQLLDSYNQQLFVSIFNIINSYDNQKDTYFQSPYISCLSSSINLNLSKLLSSYFLIYTSFLSSCNIIKDISSTLIFIKQLSCLKPFISNLMCMISLMDATSSIGLLITNVQMFLSIMGDLSIIDVYLARLQWTKTYIETLNFYLSILTSKGLIKRIIQNYVSIKYNFWDLFISYEDQELNYTLSESDSVKFISGRSESGSSVVFICEGGIKIKMQKALFTDIHIFITNFESVIKRLIVLQEITKHLNLINQTTLYLEHFKSLIIHLKILIDYVNRSMSIIYFKNHLEIIKSFMGHLKCIKEEVNTLKDFESCLNDLITCLYVLNSMGTLGSIKEHIGNTKTILERLREIQYTFNEVHDLVNLIKGEQSPESFLKILESIKSNVGSLKNTQVLIKNFADLMNEYINSLKRSSELNIESLKLIASIYTVIELSGAVIKYLESIEFVIKNYTVVQHVLMNFVSFVSVLSRLESFLMVTKSLQNIEIVIILLKYYRIILEEFQYAVSMINVNKVVIIIGDLKEETKLKEYIEEESYEITCSNDNGNRCVEELTTSKSMTTKETINSIINGITENFVNLKGVLDIFSYILAILPIKGYVSMVGRIQSVKFFTRNMWNMVSMAKDARRIRSSRGILGKILGYNQVWYLITIFTQVLRRFSYLENTLASSRSILTSIAFITYNEAVLKNILRYISNLRATINTDVTNLESSLETVLQDFIQKSLQSTICNLKGSKSGEKQEGITLSTVTPKSNINQYGNSWEILSHSAVADSKFVITRVYGSKETVNESLTVLNRVEYCKCVSFYKWNHKSPHDQHVLSSFSYERAHHVFHGYKGSKNDRMNDSNRLCLCLVIKFYLYPALVKCLCRLIDTDLDILSTINRRFEKYYKKDTFSGSIFRTILLVIDLLARTTCSMRNRYLRGCNKNPCECRTRSEPVGFIDDVTQLIESEVVEWVGYSYDVVHKLSSLITGQFLPHFLGVFCKSPNDPYYQFYISLILFICNMIENIFENEITGDSIQSLSILVDELSFTRHPTKGKCPPGEQELESKSASSLQTIISSITKIANKAIMLGLYKSISWTPRISINILNCVNPNSVANLNYLVDQLWVLTVVLNLLISSGMNDYAVGGFEKILCTISKNVEVMNKLEFLGQFFPLLSITLVRSRNLYGLALQHIENITDMVFGSFMRIVSKCGEKKKEDKDKCMFENPADRAIVFYCISLLHYWYNHLPLQLSNKVVLDFMVYSENCKKEDKIGYYLTLRTISYPENMCKHSRTNRIVDSTNEKGNKVFEGGSDNNYTYNDAYRINTSRAHGSLILPVHNCTPVPRWSTFVWLF